MTGGSGAAGWNRTWPGWPAGWASPGGHDDCHAGPPGPDRRRPAGDCSGHAGAASQPVPAEPAAAPAMAPAIAVRAGLAAGPACPGDDVLPGCGLGRWAGHRQHRTWAATLAVRPRRRRRAVTGARLLVDSAQRGAVGVRPGQLPGRNYAGPVDPGPSRAPDG